MLLPLPSNPNSRQWKAKTSTTAKCVSHRQSYPNDGLAALFLSCYVLRLRKCGPGGGHSLWKAVAASFIKACWGTGPSPHRRGRDWGVFSPTGCMREFAFIHTQLANWMVWGDWNTPQTKKLKSFRVTLRCVVNMYKCALAYSVMRASNISVMAQHDKACLLKQAVNTTFRARELKA